MKFLKPGQALVQVQLEEETTLRDVLEKIGEEFVEAAIYRTAGGPLGEDDLVTDADIVIVAQAEANG